MSTVFTDYKKLGQEAVGKTVQRKGTEKKYKVAFLTDDLRVKLEPLTKGARACYKWVGHLWLDFTEVK